MKIKFPASGADAVFKRVRDYIKEGKSYIIEIKTSVKNRSLPQNKYYWGVVITLFSQQSGYTKDEAHQFLAGIHLKYEKDGHNFIRSTTTLSKLEFEKYAEECRLFMWHNLGIHVPLPNEVNDDFLIHMDNIYNY